jgi:hypothetical protein
VIPIGRGGREGAAVSPERGTVFGTADVAEAEDIFRDADDIMVERVAERRFAIYIACLVVQFMVGKVDKRRCRTLCKVDTSIIVLLHILEIFSVSKFERV